MADTRRIPKSSLQAIDPSLRVRVEHLLVGDFRREDMIELFHFLRDRDTNRAGGRESLIEVGDFVAHPGNKDRGIMNQATREAAAVLSFMAWGIGDTPGKTRPIDLARAPSFFLDFLDATRKRIDHQTLRQSGVKRAQAYELLRILRAETTKNDDGTLWIPLQAGTSTFELVNLLSSLIIFQPTLTQHRLYEDFVGALLENGLLDKSERKTIRRVQPFLTLFAVSKMHNCTVSGAEFPMRLAVSITHEREGETISISACGDVPYKDSYAPLCYTIFTTTLKAFLHIEMDLLIRYRDWPFTIQVNSGCRLEFVN